MRAYESISMHMHAHAALTLFCKRLFFLQSFFFFKFYLFQKQISDIRYTICLNPIKIPLSCLIWVHFGWGENHQMAQITSRNHTAWGPIQRVGLLVNTAYPMQSVKTRMGCLSFVAFLKSQNNFKILI